MGVIETMTFRLREDADEAAFLAVDKRVQSDFAYQQPGLVRRTTARGVGGHADDWLVIDIWSNADAADACAQRWDTNAVAQEFMSFVERASVDVRRYADLE